MLPESSLGTLIKQRAYDNNSIKRMVQYNSWHQMPYKERSLYKICCKIASCSKMNGLPTIIIERAKEFYNIIDIDKKYILFVSSNFIRKQKRSLFW